MRKATTGSGRRSLPVKPRKKGMSAAARREENLNL
jgi:hypothetical protein